MPESRIAKALRLLRIDRQSDPMELADALWLASRMPAPAPEPRKRKTKSETQEAPEELPEKTGTKKKEEPPPAVPPPDPAEAAGKLFAPVRPKAPEAAERATYVKVAAGRALPNRLEIERALKPFLRRFVSRRSTVLDEQATAERSAEENRIEPMFKPAPERWFDVAIIVEDSPEMRVWSDTLRQLDALMQRHGAFRQVRSFQYRVAGGRVHLFNRYGQPVQPKFLTDPEKRRLCLVVTNGADPAWREPALPEFVRDLGRNNVASILQMLPRRLWPHTALGDALDWVYSKEPGTPNCKLWVQDPFGAPDTRVSDADYAPVLTLEPDELKQWARFVQSPRRVMSAAVWLAARQASVFLEDKPAPKAETLVREFRGIASPQAFRLLRLSAAALPLTVPILRLIQESMSGGQQTVHLAELLFSGLVQREEEDEAGKPLDEIYFDFAPGVRDLLLDTLSSGEQRQAEEALEPARERLGKYLEEKTGLSDIRVLLRDKEGSEALPESARAFLEVNRRVLERLRPAVTETPAVGAVSAIQFSTGGHWLAIGRDNGQVELWGERRLIRTFPGDSNRITAIACHESDGWIVAGTSSGNMLIWQRETAKLLKHARPHDHPIVAIYIEPNQRVYVHFADGRTGSLYQRRFEISRTPPPFPSKQAWSFGKGEFLIVGDGALYLSSPTRPSSDRPIGFFPPGATVAVAAVSPDGYVAFRQGPELGIYLIEQDRLSQLLARVRMPEHRLAALSPGGREVAYVATDGSIGFLGVPKQPVARTPARKAHAPRNVAVIGGDDIDLARAIVDDLVDAGHKLVRDSNEADWLVVQRPAAAHPLIEEWVASEREVLYIGEVAEIAHALDAIDLPPPGPLVDFEPPILNDIPRPELEARIAKLYLHPPRNRVGFYAPSYSGAINVLLRVARAPEVRAFYPGGIYRGAETLPKRPGRKLLLLPLPGVRLGRGDLQVRHVLKTRQHDLEIENVTDAEANSYLWRAADLNLSYRRLAELKLFHDNVPRLVCLTAGLLTRFGAEWSPSRVPAKVKDRYEVGVAQIVKSLPAPLQHSLVAHAVMGANPPEHLAQAFGGPELREVAESCRWLYASPGPPALPLLVTAKHAIKRVAPSSEAPAHESIVQYYENPNGDFEARFHDRYWAEHLIGHAAAAGRAARVEKLLRVPHVLERFLALPPAEWRDQLREYGSRNRFAAKLKKTLEERTRSGARAPFAAELIQSIDQDVKSEAARPRWPKSSGVAAAHKAGISGKGIEILLFADGCDVSHPELAGADIIAPIHGALGTAAASIIVGRHLGVAPGVRLVLAQSSNEIYHLTHLVDIIVFADSYMGRPDWSGVLEQLAAEGSLIIGKSGKFQPGEPLPLPVSSKAVLAVGSADFQNRWSKTTRRGVAGVGANRRFLPEVYGYGVNVPVAGEGEGYVKASGSTFAVAYVAGIAALVAERTGLRGQRLRERLLRSAKKARGNVVRYDAT